MSLSSYLITCLTEQIRVVSPYVDTPPTTCPNNTAHTIDPTQTAVFQTINMSNVTVFEKENGYFQATSICHTIPSTVTPPEVTIYDQSWPCDIYLMSTTIYLDDKSVGDTFDIICAPDTPVGTLIDDVDVSGNTLHVSSTVSSHVTRGMHVSLSDGVNKNDLGRITSTDIEKSLITVETATENGFSIGTLVLMNVHTVYNFGVCTAMISPNGITFGNRPLNGKIVPANTTIRLTYTNSTGTGKVISCKTEYMILS
jgi:hypothetical protein